MNFPQLWFRLKNVFRGPHPTKKNATFVDKRGVKHVFRYYAPAKGQKTVSPPAPAPLGLHLRDKGNVRPKSRS